jgi:hypothetical protein
MWGSKLLIFLSSVFCHLSSAPAILTSCRRILDAGGKDNVTVVILNV